MKFLFNRFYFYVSLKLSEVIHLCQKKAPWNASSTLNGFCSCVVDGAV